jgi:hypothetical protein
MALFWGQEQLEHSLDFLHHEENWQQGSFFLSF